MRDEDRIRILHMIDAAETVAQFMEGRSRDDLDRCAGICSRGAQSRASTLPG
ncbi:MAG TPA: hypothetical protein VGG20_15780 [Thermoanaerobaculia bacterium]|jgi:hypothetical protein